MRRARHRALRIPTAMMMSGSGRPGTASCRWVPCRAVLCCAVAVRPVRQADDSSLLVLVGCGWRRLSASYSVVCSLCALRPVLIALCCAVLCYRSLNIPSAPTSRSPTPPRRGGRSRCIWTTNVHGSLICSTDTASKVRDRVACHPPQAIIAPETGRGGECVRQPSSWARQCSADGPVIL